MRSVAVQICFTDSFDPDAGMLVWGGRENSSVDGLLTDDVAIGAVRRALRSANFIGAFAETIDVTLPDGPGPDRILIVGIGDDAALTRHRLEQLGGKIVKEAQRLRMDQITVDLEGFRSNSIEPGTAAVRLAVGMRLKSYKFDRFRTWTSEPSEPPGCVRLASKDMEAAIVEKRFALLSHDVDGVYLARDLTFEPPNVMTPGKLAAAASSLSELGISVRVWSGEELEDQRFPGVEAVGRGSVEASHVAIMEWRGPNCNREPGIGLAGKGVTFDSGGLTPKSESQQRLMKMDMAGAAALIGTMHAVAARKLDIGVVAAIGAVENLSGSSAYRSGDVLTMRNGTTVEVSFPDAEGRLVLADLIDYLRTTYRLQTMIDVATLTYTVVAALGDTYSGLFTNNDALADAILSAAGDVGERIWRLPVDKHYLGALESHIADLKNMPAPGPLGLLSGSASVAAAFLEHFAGGLPWAHLDITGAAWAHRPHDLGPEGATGATVRTLVAWLEGQVPDLD